LEFCFSKALLEQKFLNLSFVQILFWFTGIELLVGDFVLFFSNTKQIKKVSAPDRLG
jgi:hypothetical protein